MTFPKTATVPVVALMTLAALAGCVAPEEYQSVDPRESEGVESPDLYRDDTNTGGGGTGAAGDCETPYVTQHYNVTAPVQEEQVQQAFEDAGYRWSAQQGAEGVGVAERAGGDAMIIVAYDPGTSGDSLIVSALATDDTVSESQVALAANAADEVVRQAFPNATAEERIEGGWTTTCGEPPDPVEIGRAGGGGAGGAGGAGTAPGGQETDYETDAGQPTSGQGSTL